MVQEKLKVGILGATGTVGQRFILHLSDHPQFTLSVLGASSSSTDKSYQKATEGRWKQVKPIPDNVKEMVLKECVPEHFKDCDIVFSGLDSGPAAVCEPAFRSSNLRVFSNAKNYRMDPLCPLVVPLVNPSHFSIIKTQQQSLTPSPSKGFIITNANCSTTGIVIPLKALMDKFGPLDKIMVSTMQAISGAGYPGVSSFDILGNVVPYISGEEEKIEMEVAKILGQIQTDKEGKGKEFKDHEVTVSASCNRVAVIDGHMECVSLSFKNRPPPGIEEVKQCLKDYVSEAQKLKVHSAPEIAIKVHEELDRPQPRLDVDFQNGAGVNVGRVRECKVLDVKFVVLSNNVQIGAATSSVMNAEIALSQGYLS